MILTPEIQARLNRARRTLQAAQAMIQTGFPEEAVSRAYYAMFYAASAMHRAEGRIYKRHDSLISEFGKYFVVPAKVSKDFHETLRKAFDLRKSADYESFVESFVTPAQAEAIVKEASEFITMAEKFLEGTGGHIE